MYSSGVVISHYCHGMSATPDRKVYFPSRSVPYDLLEIKCLSWEALSDVKCLKRINDVSHLKRVTIIITLFKCKWLLQGYICMNFSFGLMMNFPRNNLLWKGLWNVAKEKLDMFYFNYFFLRSLLVITVK